MKILLDECLPLDFRRSFRDREAHTVQWADLKGKKNGELLQATELAGYEVFLTVDQGIPHHQNFAGRTLSVVLLRTRTSQIEELLPLVDTILKVLETIQPGQILAIPLSV
jgi:predicted nuclease of predicted toxin-antitoxin system